MRPLSGYPTSWGNKKVTIAPIAGPSVYVEYVAPSTGGQEVQAHPYGVKVIDKVIAGISRSGLYRVECVQIEASTVNGVSLGATQFILMWFVIATGAQVAADVDLDAEIVDVMIIGDQ